MRKCRVAEYVEGTFVTKHEDNMISLNSRFVVVLALVCVVFPGSAEDASAQTNPNVFYVYANCNVDPCTIGVAGHGWTSPGWRTLSQSYVGGARAWRAACHFHYDNPRYFSPDIANGTVDCAEMRNEAAILDGNRPPPSGGGRDLRPGDRYYPEWIRCVDLPNNRSRWTNRSGEVSDWSGDCAYWGID